MFVYCGNDEPEYLINTDNAKVYELLSTEEGKVFGGKVLKQDMYNFLRWNPYLKELSKTDKKPSWLK